MCRKTIYVFVLAALAISSANGSPVTLATGHKTIASAHATHHRKAHRAYARPIARRRTAAIAPCIAPAEKSPADQPPAIAKTTRRVTRPSGDASATAALPAADQPAEALLAAPLPASLHRRSGPMPPPLRGSFYSLERQNQRLAAEGLERIEDEDDLADRIARKALVPLPASASITVNAGLPRNHRYCRPWTARFLSDFARAHEAQFHRPIEVSSAVRTVEYQKRLMETNGNAAAAEGDVVSPHLTGSTIDITKDSLSRQEMAWIRAKLLALERTGKIDVEEEFQQACFHITVYKTYAPPGPAPRSGQRSPATARTRPTRRLGPPPAPSAQGL